MPAYPPVPNVLRVDLHWAIGGDPLADTRLHFKYSGGPPAVADVTAFATDSNSAAVAQLVALLAADRSFLGTKVTDLSSDTGAQGEVAVSDPGTLTGTGLAPGSSALVNYPIDRRYRGGKPRSYFPFGDNTKLATTGLWLATWVTDFENAVNAYINLMNGKSSGSTSITTLVNVSYYKGFTSVQNPVTMRWRNIPTLRATPVVDDVAPSSALGSVVVGSQRRRNRAA